MYENPEPGCWLHPHLEVRSSPISGEGLFATAPIPAGTVVSRLGGHLVTWETVSALMSDPAHPYVDTITVTADLHLVLPPDTPNGKGNHSCDPNLWWTGPYTLATRRPLSPGEEATNDYATSTTAPDFTLDCQCGTPLCRRLVTGSDWRNPDLRRRYGDHWIPALLTLIHDTT